MFLFDYYYYIIIIIIIIIIIFISFIIVSGFTAMEEKNTMIYQDYHDEFSENTMIFLTKLSILNGVFLPEKS